MTFKKSVSAAWTLLAFSAAAFAGGAKFPAEGIWRGEFTVDGDPIPFNFEVKGTDVKDAEFTLLNGTRRDLFHVERVSADTLSVPMNTYDAALLIRIVDGEHLTGEYQDLVPNRKGARNLAFKAEHGRSWRFVEPGKDVKAEADLSGQWAIQQADKSSIGVGGKEASAQEVANRRGQVALLKQEGNRLTGVFMTSVGDSRELEGTVQGNRFWLSHFSGPSPRLIKGTVDEDGNIQGAAGSGIYNVVKFEGHKDAGAQLADPYKLTFLKDGQRRIDFSFPDLEGKPVSLSDDKYKGKVVIVEVIGTWCPNCTDQTRFLAPWFKENQKRGVEAIAIAFEQEDDFAYFQKTLGKFKSFFDIRYDLLFGGIADKKVATEKLKGLNYMAAFPTTFLIDRRGEVREIYTGFTGTITGKYYDDYVKKFNAVLDELIAEPNPFEQKLTLSRADEPAKDSSGASRQNVRKSDQESGRTLRWHVDILPAHAKPGNDIEIVFTADIVSGWILYSSDFSVEIGPRPAKFIFDANPALAFAGPVRAVGSRRKKDTALGVEYTYFASRAEFRRKARLVAPLKTVSGRIDAQTCFQESGLCELFRERFSAGL